MATTQEPKTASSFDSSRPGRKRNIRPHIAAIGRSVAEEDRKTLDLLEAYDRGDPEVARQLADRSR